MKVDIRIIPEREAPGLILEVPALTPQLEALAQRLSALDDGTLPGFQEDRACFSLSLIPFQAPELVWYWFRFWRDDGTGCLLDKTGYRSAGDPIPWQLTVYEESRTPAWFGEGVTYQIFPDRYCRLSVPDPAGLVGNRWVHERWEDGPEWRPDSDGR